MIKYLKDEEFESEVANGLVLVDFYADWCGPCKMISEILETVEDVNILKVNTDEHTELALNFGIMSIPTLILFKDGNQVDKLIGLQSKTDILEFIEKNK